MKRTFFQRHGLLLLMIVFFLVPFAFRGARIALQDMRNEVKDWLPSGFPETKELDKFREQFRGESFIAVSWDGCTGDREDFRFRTLVDKFVPEVPPSQRHTATSEPLSAEAQNHYYDDELNLYIRQLHPRTIEARSELIGNRLGLYSPSKYFRNWGGADEIWMRGEGDKWFYLLPNGDLYRWSGTNSPMAAILRATGELFVPRKLSGEHIASLGALDGPWYHQNPRRLEADLFASIVTGPSLLYDLTKEGGVIEGQTEEAMRRLQGWLFGPDQQQTCVYVTLSEHGRQHLHRIIGRGILGRARGKLYTLAEESGVQAPPRPSLWPPPLDRLVARTDANPSSAPLLRLGGPPVDNVAIDEEGQVNLLRLVGLSIGLGLIISWVSFRSIPIVLMLTFVGLASAQASLAFVGWSGCLLDAVLMAMPSLVYVLGLSGAIHLVNYYRDTVIDDGFPGSPEKALREGWVPCTLAAFTTALGLVSLAISDIVPIRKFGFYSALGVVFTLILLFTFLPAVLALWPPRSFERQRAQFLSGVRKYDALEWLWNRLSALVVRHHAVVTVLVVLSMVVFGLQLRKVETSVQLLKLFDPRNKLIQDYVWMETNLGKLVPMELVVRVAPSMMHQQELTDSKDVRGDEKFRLTFLDRAEIGESIRRAVDDQFGGPEGGVIGTAMLASTFVPPLPDMGRGWREITFRNTFSRRLASHREELVASGYFRIDDEGNELWRVSLRLGALIENMDYGQFVVSVKAAVEPVLAAYQTRNQVLRMLSTADSNGTVRGKQVVIAGDASLLKSIPLSDDDSPVATVSQTSVDRVNQDAIYVRTLFTLLKNAAVGCHVLPLADDTNVPSLVDKARQWDAFVFTSGSDRIRTAIQDADIAGWVDARGFRFDPKDEHNTAQARECPVSVAYTGLVPVVYKAQRTLLKSLVQSTWGAFAAILVVMILVLRSPTAGLVSMIPNVFPIIIVFGFMGWRHILVDIGTMMTASIALGVAVDGTLHYLTWFRRALELGHDRITAIHDAYMRCGTAMVQTTVIAGVGLSVFGFSTFAPTQRFGILMLTLLFTALVGDLFVFPAILAGPMGRVFQPRSQGRSKAPPVTSGADGSPSHAPSNIASAAPLATPHESFLRNLARPYDRALPSHQESTEPSKLRGL